MNLPTEELESVERICFQVEEAQWFYEDFIRPLDPELESLNLKNFSLKFFRHCPMFSDFSSDEHLQAFAEFLAYKTRVPVRGAIMLNEKMDEVVLVKGWKKGANWSFPRGKINKDEPDLDCAIREVYEETGYDIKAAGLISKEEETESFEMDLREQNVKLFVFRAVPMDTYFEPRTRKEISKIQWWKLNDLPTLKKKKQQQEGYGGDLASSANRFYMVAPFLPRLKKYIASQKKLDKVRRSSVAAAIPVAIAEGPMPVEDNQAADETAAAASNGEMARLLDGLRQSAGPVETIDLPEAAMLGAAAKDIAAQLKNFLGVPLSSPETVLKSPSPELVSNPKANSLLALLQNKPAQPAQLPQTPMEQVIEQPKLPLSPPHPRHQHQRFSAMPPPPAFPTQDQLATGQAQQPRPPQTHSIPPPKQPAQLVPRNPNTQYHEPALRGNAHHQTIAPYQRTGDPRFAQYAQVTSNQPSSIPRASNLPPPKLNAQSSALLSLFKTCPTAKASIVTGDAEVPVRFSQPAGSTAPTVNIMQHSVARRDSEETVRAPSQEMSRQGSRPTNMFVPPQVSPTAQLSKAKEADKPKSEHHGKLLDLFRSPSATTAKPSKPAGTTLQLPSTPVELSALPTTPSHSREPSKTDEPVYAHAPVPSRNGSVRLEKRPRKNTAKLQKPPVSATVNGPLNVPQFEMVAKASKDAKQAGSRMDHTSSPKRSPVKILARPASSQAGPSTRAPNATIGDEAPVKHQKVAAPKVETCVTPVKKPPPTPDLKAQEAPPKSFHPQILRRPAHVDDSNGPSPIQPLPSPIINTFPDRRTTQPTDHKKSLLSLFTEPSPSISPPSAAPTSAIDLSALISPLTGPSPQEQAEAAFARLTQSVGELSHEPKPVPGPSQLPGLRTGSINNAVDDGMSPRRSSGKQTPTLKTTPADKSFLLGYLNKVLESGR